MIVTPFFFLMVDSPVLTESFRWNSLQRKIQEHKIRKAFEIFRENGIEPLVFKGWASARYYPSDRPRSMGDIDLAVDSTSYSTALRLVKREDVRRLHIDLHNEFRHLDTVPWNDVVANSELIEIDGCTIRVPRPEDHLRLICVHWLTDGGAHHDKLWDVYYLVSNRSAKFDWSRCLGVVAPHRRRWIVCAIALAHRYLDLDVTGLPFRDELERIPDWISKCVEKEWRRGGNIEPILTSFYDLEVLLDQFKRRFPPNPLRSVIEAEGNIDRRIRFDYQLRVLGRRSLPFVRDVSDYLKRRFKDSWSSGDRE